MPRSEKLLDGAAEGLATMLASGMTRRSFLGRLGGAVLAATGGAAVAAMMLTYGHIFDQALAACDQVLALIGG